jgi:predicted NBD/HSP70 family sugar kinase
MGGSEADSSVRWGIDLGGTKIEGVVLRGSDVLCRVRVATEAEGGYEHILGRIGLLVREMETASALPRPSAIGLGMPGNSDPDSGLMRNANTVCLIGRPLLGDLSQLLGVRVAAANDANCFALAEALLGAGRGAGVVFGVIMGTGVGGGIVVNGAVLNGRQSIAGEWGHNVLEPGGAPCYCGKRGCVETVLSGPGLERWYREAGGEALRLPEIVSRAETGEARAMATIDRLCEKFGEGLSVVVNILEPDVIVLGGGVGNVSALYERGVAALGRWVFSDRLLTRVVRPELGDSAGVFGAALLEG